MPKMFGQILKIKWYVVSYEFFKEKNDPNLFVKILMLAE